MLTHPGHLEQEQMDYRDKYNLRGGSGNCRGTVFLLVCALLIHSGCRTASPTGVRADYRGFPLEKITLVPAYQTGPVGSADPALLAAYESSIESWGERNGVEIASASALRQSMTEAGVWDAFEAGVDLRRQLVEYFEGEDLPYATAEALTVMEFANEGMIESAPLLFVEISYHASADCSSKFTAPSRAASVWRHPVVKDAVEGPCLIDNLHAKLVEPSTGRTMWYNWHRSEYLVPNFEASREAENITRVVDMTLGGRRGLTAFR